jgi:DNA polymerase sigma
MFIMYNKYINKKQTINTCQLSKCKNQQLVVICRNNTKMLKCEIWSFAKKIKLWMKPFEARWKHAKNKCMLESCIAQQVAWAQSDVH